jgi:hypothetical protein
LTSLTDAAFHRADFATVKDYDVAINSWTTKTPMQTGRAGLGFPLQTTVGSTLSAVVLC